MRLALAQAKLAADVGEVPVGAVVIAADGAVLGQAHNRTISNCDPSAHAEILALRQAAAAIQNYRLENCTVYITLEPCAMCAAAMLHARIARVVYAVADAKTGAAGSVLNLFTQPQLNHHTTIELLKQTSPEAQQLQRDCTQQLQQFFSQRRNTQRQQRHNPQHAPLRDDALRPPPQHFAAIPQIAALQTYSQWHLAPDGNKPAWRMHYWDTDTHHTNKPTAILLHGYSSYCLLWAEVIPQLQQHGWRVLAPDILGFGHSDKPKKAAQHNPTWHNRIMHTWLDAINISQATKLCVIACDNANQLIPKHLHPHAIALLPQPSTTPNPKHWRTQCQHKTLFDVDAHWALNTAEQASHAWSAPFIDAGHRAALHSHFWANNPTPQPNLHTLTVPDNSGALRQWLNAHILSLCNTSS